MDFVRTFFSLNNEIIYFGYGLVFFVLGLAIALQSRSHSRLDLARSLTWLSAFGFAHGFFEWGELFIPIQSAYLSPSLIEWLHRFHLLLLAVSFTFLFKFGVTLLRPLGRANRLDGLPTVVLAVWIFGVYYLLPQAITTPQGWHDAANALARYFICIPGGLLAAYGLRQHTFQRIVPLNVPDIVKMLQIAGGLLVLYVFFAGLVVPPVPFFPGNWLNAGVFDQILGVPVTVFRSLVGFGLVIAIIRALEIFDVEVERMIENVEQQQILAAERDRLARELHDGAIQKVYTAGLLVDSSRKLAADSGDQLQSRLERAAVVLDDAIGDLRRNLGELRATPPGESLAQALRSLAGDPRFRSLVDISLDLDLPAELEVAPARVEHVLAITNEALSNIVRHSRARHAWIHAHKVGDQLKLKIEDDGIGMPENLQMGYGLRNMEDRARLLGGSVDITGKDGRGTVVSLDIPWKDER